MTAAPSRAGRAAAVALGALAFAGAVAGIRSLRASLNRRFDASRRVLDDASIPRPWVARVLSLGHTEWVTDILWVNATLYYGETLFAHLPSRYIDRYTETMIALDPGFRRAYVWGATSLLSRTVMSTEADARRAGQFLRQGLARFPTDPELHLELGLNLAFNQAAYTAQGSERRRALRAEGAEHLRFAAVANVGPPWLPLTASTLLRAAGRDLDAVLVLGDGLTHTDDPTVFPMIEARLAELQRERGSEHPLAQAFLDLARSRRQYHPWMPPTLHVFVGAPVLPRDPARPW